LFYNQYNGGFVYFFDLGNLKKDFFVTLLQTAYAFIGNFFTKEELLTLLCDFLSVINSKNFVLIEHSHHQVHGVDLITQGC
jgi:hypothetical protein